MAATERRLSSVRRVSLGAGIVIAIAGCGSRPPPTPPPSVDLDEEEPVLVAGIELPALPLDVDRQDLEDGWVATEAALTMPTPRPPDGEDWEVEVWADEELMAWVRRRAEAVSAAQRALEPARTGGDADLSVVASALLGLAYSRFALDLRGIPTPSVFEDDPVRAAAFRSALDAAAAPLWQRALDAYGSCSSVAGAAPAHSLSRWRERCDREIRSVSAMIAD